MSLLLQITVVLIISVAVIKWYLSLRELAGKDIKSSQALWICVCFVIDLLLTVIVVGSAMLFLTPSASFGGGAVGAFFFTLIVIPVFLCLNIGGFLLSVMTHQSKWGVALMFYALPTLVLVFGLNISHVQKKSGWDSRNEAYMTQLMTPSSTRFVCQGDASILIQGAKVLIEMIEGEPSLSSNPVGGYLDDVAGTFTWYADYDFSSEASYGSIMRKALQTCKNSEGKALLEIYSETPYAEPVVIEEIVPPFIGKTIEEIPDLFPEHDTSYYFVIEFKEQRSDVPLFYDVEIIEQMVDVSFQKIGNIPVTIEAGDLKLTQPQHVVRIKYDSKKKTFVLVAVVKPAAN